jgi:4-amino-4-deoxy-L-arabinose transferase-like glycosyltransferase
MSLPSSRSERPTSFVLWVLFVLTVAFFCLGNQQLLLIDRDEPRFAEAAREMMQRADRTAPEFVVASGEDRSSFLQWIEAQWLGLAGGRRPRTDWIVPTFNGGARYDKPPLIYWMQIACYRWLGDNEFAARLPAAFCMGAVAVVLVLWGSALASRATGLLAALIFVTCLQVFVHGRAAVADPPLILWVVVAAWSGWEWLRLPQKLLPGLCFWGALALGFLAKGPIAWVPVGMVGWAAWKRRSAQRSALEARLPGAWDWGGGVLVMFGLVSLWGVPALLLTHGEFASVGLGKHVVGRSLGSMEGHGAKHFWGYLVSLPAYFLLVFPSFAPWSFWLPAAWRSHWRRPTPETAYLMSGVVLVFVIFTLSRTKLPHYTLPAFPFLALLLALWWRENKPASTAFRVVKWTGAIFAFIALCAFPLVRKLSVTELILDKVRPELSAATAVALVGYEEPSLIWGLRKTVSGYVEKIAPEQVAEWLQKPGPRVCILKREEVDGLRLVADQTPPVRFEAEGLNLAKGRRVSLVALVAVRQ